MSAGLEEREEKEERGGLEERGWAARGGGLPRGWADGAVPCDADGLYLFCY